MFQKYKECKKQVAVAVDSKNKYTYMFTYIRICILMVDYISLLHTRSKVFALFAFLAWNRGFT